ncbi:MAG: DUF4962 domain-containing protein [Acidobacteria bacterium]|nr:DUF4962 domain-containing protein [Acidobacteriota bacterium]
MTVIFLLTAFLYLATAQTNAVNEKIPPFKELLKRPVKLRPELVGKHPRLFFTAADLPQMRERAKGVDRELWQQVLKDIQTLKRNAPDPKDEDLYKSGLDKRKEGSISQYEFAFQIAQTSYAYAVEGDEKYLEAAKKWTLAACAMPIWGYTYNKPNVDLPPAHLLYAVAFAYDVLHDKLTKDEKEIIRNKLVKQARLMYDYFKYKPKKRYTYSQNHTWIPMAGLAIAAYALMDEIDEAQDWARLSRAVFDRTMLAFGTDGFFYESFHYFGFAFRWMIRYFDAHLEATGENLYLPMRDKFAGMKYYAMHSILPDGENVFDFADVGDGALNRNGTSKREKLYGEYDILYRFAGIYRDARAQTIADFIRKETTFETREPMWAFINHDAGLKPAPLIQIPLQVYFDDNDTVFWRSDWTKNATAFAFRAAPPEGHAAARLASKISDWRQNTGHAHPDANSFIIWANGEYLTGDSGYAGVPLTEHHNTLIFGGRGQAKEDRGHDAFAGVLYERLNQIRITDAKLSDKKVTIIADATAAYEPEVGVKRFVRKFEFTAPDDFLVTDEVELNQPQIITSFLHADNEIKQLSGKTFLFEPNGTSLLTEIIAPKQLDAKIEKNILTAPGRPGSVDKGEREERGVRLAISTKEKMTKTNFVVKLTIQER